MSAPHRLPKRRSLDDQPPKWVNPCGYSSTSDDGAQISDIPGLMTEKEFLLAILVQTNNALDSVERFKNEYVKEVFDVDFVAHHNTWKKHRYEWLYPSDAVPKKLGVQLLPEELRSVQLDSFLKDAYRYMQIMAVAMEQVAFDHAHPDHGSVFAKEFKDVEYKLKAVLCELQVAMIERGVEPHDDVTRDVMTDDIRDMDSNSYRNLRDWFIFRDYMIVLEYIKDVVKYFYDNPSKISPS